MHKCSPPKILNKKFKKRVKKIWPAHPMNIRNLNKTYNQIPTYKYDSCAPPQCRWAWDYPDHNP